MHTDISVKQSSGFTSEQVATVDYLINTNYRLDIPNCPILSQTATKLSIPKINIGAASQMTPQLNIPHIGDSLITAPLVVTFPVLSDLSNYMEIYTWIYRMLADDLVDARSAAAVRQYGVGTANRASANQLSLDEFYVDSGIILYDRNNNPSCNVNFLGLFPTDLSSIDFNALSTSQEPVEATVSFRYIMHTITPVIK